MAGGVAITNELTLLYEFFSRHREADYDRGEIVFESYAKQKKTFYLTRGFVKSYFINSDGHYNILTLYGPGSIFPLGPALREDIGKSPYHLRDTVYFEAITDVRVFVADSSELVSFCEKTPEAYREMLTALISNYELYLSRVEGSLMKHARQRIVHQLMVLSSSFATETYGQLILEVPLTHQDLADCLGMARETVSRELERLRYDGLLDTKDRHIILLDLEALQAEVEQ